ncbi:Fe-S oxidoreductase [Candidatus Magnetomorum sp. HK-1]|nr:Fe-S oxidoreductase [Candidatus Magnetomorum sp. HK-1]
MHNLHKEKNNLICLVKIDNHLYRDVPPLGVLYLASALSRNGYRVEIYHIENNEIAAYGQIILKKNPLFVGFSVVTGWGVNPAVDLSRIIKNKSQIPIVWGNVHPSCLPQQCLSEDYIDIVCIGESEETVVKLASALENKSDLSEISGIGYKKSNNQIIINPRRSRIKNLDQYDIDWDLVDINRYITSCWGIKRTLRVITSRGCPFNCLFCYNLFFNQRQWYSHSAQYVIQKLSNLVKAHNIEALYFNDDNFFVNQKWAWEVLNGLKVPYYASVRSELINSEFAQKLSDTGCQELLIGFESGSDAVLKNILNKGTTEKENYNAVNILSQYPQIKISGSFITAIPGETEKDVQKTIQMICKFLEIHPNFKVILAFYRPMPGTELYKLSIANGFVPPDKTEDWSCFDALDNNFELPWLDKKASKRAEALCQAMETLDALYKFNIPIVKNIILQSILKGSFDSGLLKIVNKVRTKYAFGNSEHKSTMILRRIVNFVKKQKNLN